MKAQHKLSRRSFLKAVGAGSVLAFSGAATTQRFNLAQATALFQGSGTLRIATVVPPPLDNPHNQTVNGSLIYQAAMDTLIRYDENLQPQPHLAQSWEWNDDFTEITFQLRDDVVFHTGNPLTAEAVVWNIERVRDPATSSQLRGPFLLFTEFEATDTHTLVIRLENPTSIFFDSLDTFNIMDPASIADLEAGEAYAGTGPFALREWDPGNQVIFDRNPDYWGETPAIESIEILVVPDQEAMLLNLQAGSVDMILNPSYQELEALQTAEGVEVIPSVSQYLKTYLGCRVDKAPMDNKLFRQALNWAIPRERFANVYKLGLVSATCIPWAPSSPAYDAEQDQRYRLDLDRARSLMAEAGVEPGVELILQYDLAFAEDEAMAVFMQDAFAQIGVNLMLEPLDPADWMDFNRAGEFSELWIGQHGNSNLSPGTLLLNNKPYRMPDNGSHFESEEYQRLIDAILVATDPDEQAELYNQVTELILDECFVMNFTSKPSFWVTDGGVNGLVYNTFDWPLYSEMSLDG